MLAIGIYSVTNLSLADLRKYKVKVNSTLEKHERETHIYFNDKEEYAVIETYQTAWIRHLIKHKYLKPERVWLKDGNTIVGIEGVIPKNCVRSSERPRSRFDKMWSGMIGIEKQSKCIMLGR